MKKLSQKWKIAIWSVSGAVLVGVTIGVAVAFRTQTTQSQITDRDLGGTESQLITELNASTSALTTISQQTTLETTPLKANLQVATNAFQTEINWLLSAWNTRAPTFNIVSAPDTTWSNYFTDVINLTPNENWITPNNNRITYGQMLASGHAVYNQVSSLLSQNTAELQTLANENPTIAKALQTYLTSQTEALVTLTQGWAFYSIATIVYGLENFSNTVQNYINSSVNLLQTSGSSSQSVAGVKALLEEYLAAFNAKAQVVKNEIVASKKQLGMVNSKVSTDLTKYQTWLKSVITGQITEISQLLNEFSQKVAQFDPSVQTSTAEIVRYLAAFVQGNLPLTWPFTL